jgi:hypothetical protein
MCVKQSINVTRSSAFARAAKLVGLKENVKYETKQGKASCCICILTNSMELSPS